jgi:hypothetical protein
MGTLEVSYHHVWFSQNARGYTGLLFFGLLATWLLVRALRQPTARVWLGFGLCLALSMYIHLTAMMYYLALGLLSTGGVLEGRIQAKCVLEAGEFTVDRVCVWGSDYATILCADYRADG